MSNIEGNIKHTTYEVRKGNTGTENIKTEYIPVVTNVTGENAPKINPYGVKGVPGCKKCGGSGWREGKHPHPCNECAKKTVPVIDKKIAYVSPESAKSEQTSNMEVVDAPVRKEIKVSEIKEQPPLIYSSQQDFQSPKGTSSSIKTSTDTKSQPVKEEVYEVPSEIVVDRHIERKGPIETHTTTENVPYEIKADTSCTVCKGEGFIKGVNGLPSLVCKHCAEKTGVCPECRNTGIRIEDKTICTCPYNNK